jgi:predicted MFS family arabinose efflux permease
MFTAKNSESMEDSGDLPDHPDGPERAEPAFAVAPDGQGPRQGAVNADPAPVVPATANSFAGGQEEKLFSRPFIALLGMQAAYGFSFSLFFLLPKYLAGAGATAAQIGFVMGGFGVACVLTIPFLQGIVASLGRRGAVVAATLSLAGAGFAFALIAPVGIAAVFLRAAEGVTWTVMFSTALILTAEMAPKDRLAQAIGLAGGAALIMNAVAPAIGEPLADAFGYRPVFLLAAVAALAAAALARRLPSGQPLKATGAVSADAQESSAVTALRLRMFVVFAASGLAFSVLFTFLAPFALRHGVRAIRGFFIAYTGSALTVRVLGGRLADRLGHRSIATFSLFLYGCVVASTGLLGAHHLFELGILFGLAHGALFPSLMALLISATPAHRRPRVLGIANGAMSIGISAVFPAGFVVGRIGYSGMFALAGGLVAASTVLIRQRRGNGVGMRA